MIGARLGRLTVIAAAFKKGPDWYWRCRCDCGREMEARRRHISSGAIQSCGCYRDECISLVNFRHGHGRAKSQSLTYRSWSGMLQRCNNPRNPNYPDYGGRGITVYAKWREFPRFLEDMGERPSKETSLDRIDNDGNYEPGNCRWATIAEQALNKRNRKVSEDTMKEDIRFKRWIAYNDPKMTDAERDAAGRLLFSLGVLRLNERNKDAMPLVLKYLAADTAKFKETWRPR